MLAIAKGLCTVQHATPGKYPDHTHMDGFDFRRLAQRCELGAEMKHQQWRLFHRLSPSEQMLYTQHQQRALNALNAVVFWLETQQRQRALKHTGGRT